MRKESWMYLHIQRLLPVWRQHRAVRLLLRLLRTCAQRCWAGVCGTHHSLTLQVAPLIFQVHLQDQHYIRPAGCLQSQVPGVLLAEKAIHAPWQTCELQRDVQLLQGIIRTAAAALPHKRQQSGL